MKRFKSLISIVLSSVMILSIAGCNTADKTVKKAPTESTQTNDSKSKKVSDKETKIIKNIDGSDIEVPVKVEKVGAIFGPSYEKIVLLGAEDKIVFNGDFHKDGWPWSNVIYKRLNEVPGIPNAHEQLNVEELMVYSPDLVFNFPNPSTTDGMRNAGIYVVPIASTGKLIDSKETLKVYAEALGGDAPERAKKYEEFFDKTVKKLEEVTSKIDDSEKPKVYFANQNILWTAGNKSDINEIIKLAGGVPVAEDVEGGSKTEISKEQFLEWNPDYVFVDHAGSSGNKTAEEVIAEMLDDELYKSVTAVKNDEINIVPTGVFFWDAGVQKPLMALLIAKTIHPDKFEDIDMSKELKEFYSEFFDYNLTDEETEKILRHENPN